MSLIELKNLANKKFYVNKFSCIIYLKLPCMYILAIMQPTNFSDICDLPKTKWCEPYDLKRDNCSSFNVHRH